MTSPSTACSSVTLLESWQPPARQVSQASEATAPQSRSRSEKENREENLVGKNVIQARGEDVIAALCGLKRQRADGRLFPTGNALWYYASLLYFGHRPNVSRTIEVSACVQEQVTQELLLDLGRESLDDIQTRCEYEQQCLQVIVSQLLPSIPPAAITLKAAEQLLGFVSNREWTAERKDYLRYEERRALEKIPCDSCAVCGGGDSLPPENWIVICSGCEVAVHMRCFGIKVLPEGDWFCDVCRLKPETPTCVLCLQSGGILKPTTQDKNWLQRSQSREKLWAHLYCAQVLGVRFLFPVSKDLLDLVSLSPVVWNHCCEVCGRRGGVCVTCQVCPTTFHPECWRKCHSTAPWPMSALMCRRHYPRISVTTIEIGEKRTISEIWTFARLIAKRKSDRKSEKQAFSEEENRILMGKMQNYLRRINTSGFSINIQRTTGSLQVQTPEVFSAVAPDTLQYEDLTVPGRSQEQCWQQCVLLYPELQRLRRPGVDLNPHPHQVVKKRRLVKRHCELSETVVRIPLGAVKDGSSSSTQDLSEDDLEANSYT